MKQHLLCAAFIVFFCTIGSTGCARQQFPDAWRAEPVSLLVRFHPETSLAAIDAIARRHNLTIVKLVDPPYLFLMRTSHAERTDFIIRRLNSLREIVYAEIDSRRYPHKEPTVNTAPSPSAPVQRFPHQRGEQQ